MAACLAMTTIAPSYAQTAPPMGSWLAGPGAQGSSTFIGRIEAPTARRAVTDIANLQVSGWSADTTAVGWGGVDGVEVWNGAKDKSGKKLATGSVGMPRPDVAEALGRSFTNVGFSAVVPASAWSGATAGPQTLYVYLHTPDKGTWYKTVGVNLSTAAGTNLATGQPLAFPSDPIVMIARPQEGMQITQKQRNNKFSFNGFALDRNPITDPNIQSTGAVCGGTGCAGSTGAIGTSLVGAGISSMSAYIDKPAAKGDNTIFGGFGAPGGVGILTQVLVNNTGALNTPGRSGSIISRSYGSQFDFSGWSISINPATLSVGPHTLTVTAVSSVTGALDATNRFQGKSTTASVNFTILDTGNGRIQPDPLICGPRRAAFNC